MAQLLTQVRVDESSIGLTVDRTALLKLLGIATGGETSPLVIAAPAVKVRRGKEVKLVFASDEGSACQPDQKLVALLDEAMAARAAMVQHPEWAMRDAAAALKQCRHRLAQLVRLCYLAPELVRAIEDGRHPVALTPRTLLAAELPLGWNEQRLLLGFS